jgi:hypothetical protein
MGFQKATRHKLKLRMAIDGPSKSGKTLTALRVAMVLARYYECKVAVIETEHGKAKLYVGLKFDGGLIDFDIMELDNFSPNDYINAIALAGKMGYGVIVIDQISHAWSGKGGVLEIVEKAGKAGKSKFTDGWKNATPLQNNMTESILTAPAHVICTMRSKMEYILEDVTNSQGKTVKQPTKVGMAPIQRQGIEYEFDICGSMDNNHAMTVTGSRCPTVDNKVFFEPGEEFVNLVIQWLETGDVEAPTAAFQIDKISDSTLSDLIAQVKSAGIKEHVLEEELLKRYGVCRLADLTESQAKEFTVRKRLGKGAGAAAVRNTAAKPAHAQDVETEDADVESSVPPAPDAQTHGAQVEQVVASAVASTAKKSGNYPSPDDPVSKGLLGSLENSIAKFIRAGNSQDVVTKAIRKRNPKANSPAELTNAQAEDLEASILKRLNGPHKPTTSNPQ